jgi:hypothetical protein
MHRFPVYLFLPIVLITGCSKNNSSTPSGSFSATIGSTNFQGTTTLGAYSEGANLLAVVSLSMRPPDTSAFQLTMAYPPPVDTTFISDSLSLSYTAKGTEYFAYSAQGQLLLTITSFDTKAHKLAGTFSATGHNAANYNDSVVITNGKFSSAYNVSL